MLKSEVALLSGGGNAAHLLNCGASSFLSGLDHITEVTFAYKEYKEAFM